MRRSNATQTGMSTLHPRTSETGKIKRIKDADWYGDYSDKVVIHISGMPPCGCLRARLGELANQFNLLVDIRGNDRLRQQTPRSRIAR
jgi:hypothetical protein